MRPTRSTDTFFIIAISSAMIGINAGVFFSPRCGTGERYGLSVSKRRYSKGISLTKRYHLNQFQKRHS